MAQGDLFASAPDVGSIVGGRYRLLRKLSEGGGGVVWAAADPQGTEIALKLLKWSPFSSRTTIAERFKNEFSILKSLSHPNIALIYDFGLDFPTGFYFFTSELISGGDLREMIGAPVPVLEELLLQALRALEYLRGHKLLHLDIKPHNLLIRRKGERSELALIDFGLATFQPPDRPGGTPNYMAPEMIVRRLDEPGLPYFPQPDHRTDLYALGVTFYHCLTGTQPFNCETDDGQFDRIATFRRHLTHTPPPPSQLRPEIPAYLDRIVMRLMARLPEDRYPSAIVAAQALQYRSPRRRDPECLQTLLSYLPKKGKLVGRRREWAIIEETIRAVAAGAPHVAPAICIAGGRGVGRTRLLMAAKPLAQQHEMDVTEMGTDTPLAAATLEEIARGGSHRAQAHLILIDDVDRHALGGEEAAGDGPALAAFRALLRRLKLQQRLPGTTKPRIALLFTVSAEDPELSRTLLDLGVTASVCHTIALANFTADDVREYLSVLLGETPDPLAVDQLMRTTGGNPLFLTEHLEQMIAQGQLFSLAGRPDAATLKAIGIDFSQQAPPRSLSETVLARVAALPDEAHRTALLLACWNRPVSVDELRAANGGASLEKELLALLDARLIEHRERDGRIAFAGALTGRIVRDHAGTAERAACHDAIAASLRGRRARRRAELDWHVAYGSQQAARPAALMRLADRCLDRGEPLEAASHLEVLLRLLGNEAVGERRAALVALGKAYEKAHHDREAKAAYARIAKLPAPAAEQEELRALAEEHLGLLHLRRRNLPEARRHFGIALEALGSEKQRLPARLRLENALASVALRAGSVEEAIERFEKSAAVAERTLVPSARAAITHHELGEALLQAGRVERAIEILEAELAAANLAGDAERMANRHYLLGNALRHDRIRRYDEAREHYRKGLRLARAHRLVELTVRLHNGLGNLHLKLGTSREALAQYEEGLKLAQQMESETTSVELMIGMGLAAQQMRQPDRTIEYFEAALDFAGSPKGASAGLLRRFRPTIYVSLGDAYFQKGDFAHAEGYLRKAQAIDHRNPLTPDIRYSLYGTFMEICLDRGEEAQARRYLPTVEAIARVFPTAREHLAGLVRRLGRH